MPNEKSELRITFDGPASAVFNIALENIIPGQLFAAAAYLQWVAQEEATRIAAAKNKKTVAEMIQDTPTIAIPFQK